MANPVANGAVSNPPAVVMAAPPRKKKDGRGTASTSSSVAVSPATAAAVAAASSDERLVDYEALLRLFECPVCHDWTTPPIAQCRKGHVVCGPCKKKGLVTCPVCKQRFSEVPNWMMEQIANTMVFPCKFRSHGCRDATYLTLKGSHEALCCYRPVNCRYSVRGCGQVMQFYLMESHVERCPFKPRPLQQSDLPGE